METADRLSGWDKADVGTKMMREKDIKKPFKSLKVGETLSQFVKFGIVGIGNTAVSMATYYIVLWLNPDLYLIGSILGAVLSILHAFLWSNFYVFPQKGKTIRGFFVSLGKCYLSYGGTSVLSNVMLWAEVSYFDLSKTYAPIINLLITIPLNFLLNKLWVFDRKRKGN